MIIPFLRLIGSYCEPSSAGSDFPPHPNSNSPFSKNQVGPWSIKAGTLEASKEKAHHVRDHDGKWPFAAIRWWGT